MRNGSVADVAAAGRSAVCAGTDAVPGTVVAYIVMAYIVMACIVMVYIVMALYRP